MSRTIFEEHITTAENVAVEDPTTAVAIDALCKALRQLSDDLEGISYRVGEIRIFLSDKFNQ